MQFPDGAGREASELAYSPNSAFSGVMGSERT